MRDDNKDKETRTSSWFQRFVGRAKKPELMWPFPFVEGKLSVLTLHAGVEGFHFIVGGRHVTSFPYRMVFFFATRHSFVRFTLNNTYRNKDLLFVSGLVLYPRIGFYSMAILMFT